MADAGKILTANLLLTGDVVFYAKDGTWTVRADEAFFASAEEEVDVLKAAEKASVEDNTVVSTEIITAEMSSKGVWPTRNREQIRAKGPTTHLNMGYQARFDLSGFEGA